MNEHPQYQRGGDQAKRTVVIPDQTAREPNDVGLAHGIALLEILEPRQAAMALLTLTTGLDGAAAVGMRWRDIDDISGRAVFYDPGLQVERIVPLPKITFDAIRRLPYDGRDTVFVEDLDDAWPYRLVTGFDDGGAAELTLQTFEHAFLRTAGRLRMLQMVVDQIAPPPFSVRSGQIERYADAIEAVTAHHVPCCTPRAAPSRSSVSVVGTPRADRTIGGGRDVRAARSAGPRRPARRWRKACPGSRRSDESRPRSCRRRRRPTRRGGAMTSIVIPEEFRAHDGRIEVAKLKRSVDIVEVARRLTPLRGSGAHLKGLCPFHKERTASFLVDPTRQIWHCFGCGRGGDVIQLLRDAGEPGFHDACRRLFDLAGAFASSASGRCGSAGVPRLDHVALARQAWREAKPIESTPGSAYLAARGLEGPVPRSLRFGMVPASWDDGGRPGPLRPAILAAAQDVAGRVVGIQRIFVDPGRRGYPFRPVRLSLGRIRGSALRLGPAKDTVMLTGSVEDGLALQRMFVGATVWCSLGEDNLQNVVFPAGVRKVVLAGDADAAGRAAVDRARTAHEGRAIEVDVLFPRAGKDFNAELMLLHI